MYNILKKIFSPQILQFLISCSCLEEVVKSGLAKLLFIRQEETITRAQDPLSWKFLSDGDSNGPVLFQNQEKWESLVLI